MGKSDSLSDRLLSILFHSSIVGAYIYDTKDGSILFSNDAFCRMLGYDKGALTGKNIYSFIDDLETKKKKADMEWLKINNNWHEERREMFYKAKDGSLKLCQNYSYNIDFDSKDARFVTVLDNTEDKTYEMLYQALSDVNQAIVKIDNENELLETICKTLSDNLGFDVVSIGSINTETKLYEIEYISSKNYVSDIFSNIRISVDELVPEGLGTVGRAYRSKSIVLVRDIYKDKGMEVFKQFFKELGVRSVCSIPLFKNGRIAYILLMYSYTPSLFSNNHMKLLKEMQSDVSFALDKIEKGKEERLFLESFERSPAWIVATDKEGNITKVNQTVVETTGFSKDELIGENPRIFKSGEHPDSFYKKMWDTITKGEVFRCELTNKKKDGSLLYLDAIIMPIKKNGEIYQYINVSRDITKEIEQKKRIEKLSGLYKTLSEVENLLLTAKTEKEVLKNLPQAVLKNNDFSLTFVVMRDSVKDFSIFSKSAKHSDMLGFLDYVEKRIYLGDKALENCLFAKTIKHGSIYIENNIDKNKGIESFRREFEKYALLSSFSVPIIKNKKTIGALVGVSEYRNFFDGQMYRLLKKIQNIVSYSMDRFETDKWHNMLTSATNLGFDAIVIMDRNFKIIYASDSVIEMSGYNKDEIIGAHHSIFSSKTHTKDFSKLFYEKLNRGEMYSGVITYRTKSNRLVHFFTNIIPYKIDNKIEYYIGVGKDITKQRELQETLEDILTHESLTGLLNRRAFSKDVSRFIKKTKNDKSIGAMCVINPLKLSEVNQAFGFEIGDLVIVEVASRLKKYLRSCDVIGKLESDKFAIFLEDLQTEEDALVIIVKLIERLSKPYSINSKTINMFFNVGISLYPNDSRNEDELLEQAEAALIDAKGKGKNSIGFYREEFKLQAEKRLRLKTEIQAALKNREFVMHYQPYFDTRTNKVAGAEALIRWRKNGKVIPPLEFIPYLEEIKMISEIEDWTTTEIPKKIEQWKIDGLSVVPISINISPDSFRDRDFVTGISLKTSKIDPSLVNIEIIERLFLESVNYTRDVLTSLKEKGIHISMDDFGTGYSSLSYISNLPIDYIKIDISFVRKMLSDVNTKAVVKSIISLAKDIGMKTIAEGVETQEQLEVLKSLGCDYIQGYLLSKPLCEEDFKQLLCDCFG